MKVKSVFKELHIAIKAQMRATPDTTKPPVSYQVLDATTGQQTRQFSILEKREFRRLPWIVRFLQKHLGAPRTQKVLLSQEEQNKLIHTVVQEIQELDDPTTFQQVLRPIFAIAETKCDSDEQRFMLTLFSQVLTLLMEKSAAFLQRAQQQETELGHRDHYRALTNYWVYLIIGTIYKEESTSYSINASRRQCVCVQFPLSLQ